MIMQTLVGGALEHLRTILAPADVETALESLRADRKGSGFFHSLHIDPQTKIPTVLVEDEHGDPVVHPAFSKAVRIVWESYSVSSRPKLLRKIEPLLAAQTRTIDALINIDVDVFETEFVGYMEGQGCTASLRHVSERAGDITDLRRGRRDVNDFKIFLAALASIFEKLITSGARQSRANPMKLNDWHRLPPAEKAAIVERFGTPRNEETVTAGRRTYRGLKFQMRDKAAQKARTINAIGLGAQVMHAIIAFGAPRPIRTLIEIQKDNGNRGSEIAEASWGAWARLGFSDALLVVNKGSKSALVKTLKLSPPVRAAMLASLGEVGGVYEHYSLEMFQTMAQTEEGLALLDTMPIFACAPHKPFSFYMISEKWFKPAMRAAGVFLLDAVGRRVEVTRHMLRHAVIMTSLTGLHVDLMRAGNGKYSDLDFWRGCRAIARRLKCTVENLFRYAQSFFDRRDSLLVDRWQSLGEASATKEAARPKSVAQQRVEAMQARGRIVRH